MEGQVMKIEQILGAMVREGASDGFITAGVAPSIKVHGEVFPLTEQPLTGDETMELVTSVMDSDQNKQFFNTHECNFAVTREGLGRFRASAFVQRNLVGMVLRRIETNIPTVAELDLPPILEKFAMMKRGLVIFVGGTGTGKSTSLAAMIGYRNRHSKGHIISIEDPIEFIHEHQGCIITQREVGMDTASYDVALKNSLRQAPDVIMIGEVRSAETMAQALTFAETGHLCLCTLHANNANQALDRIQSFFPPNQYNQIWMDLSLNLRAMVAQQLVRRCDREGRVAVVEILLNTPLAADYIRKGDVHLLKELMTKSTELGMQTLDQSLLQHYKAGKISAKEALRHADSVNDMRLMIKLHEKGAGAAFDSSLTYEQADVSGRYHRR
jgi:twitching motility protein PilU